MVNSRLRQLRRQHDACHGGATVEIVVAHARQAGEEPQFLKRHHAVVVGEHVAQADYGRRFLLAQLAVTVFVPVVDAEVFHVRVLEGDVGAPNKKSGQECSQQEYCSFHGFVCFVGVESAPGWPASVLF